MSDFAVLTVTHDSAGRLRRLLRSLERHLPAAPQVVVVDAASRDESVQVAREAGAEVVALNENLGFGAANNLGLERVRAPVTVLLNPDIELCDAGVISLVELAARTGALVAPRLRGADGRVQDSAHPLPGRASALWFAAFGPALPPALLRRAQPWRCARPAVVGWAIAAALAARTEVLASLGPFDAGAFLFFEDLDLCLRARKAGVPTVLDPRVTLFHAGAHATSARYAEEPHVELARRRRAVIEARLGRRALLADDLAQGLTFATRWAARGLLGNPASRPRRQLGALRVARRSARGTQPG